MVLIHGLLSNLNTTHYLVGSDICCDVMFIHLGNVAIIMVRVCHHSEPKSRIPYGNCSSPYNKYLVLPKDPQNLCPYVVKAKRNNFRITHLSNNRGGWN